MGVGRHLYVVEAYDGDVVGNGEPTFAQCFHHAERHRVVAAENGGGHGLSVDEFEHAGISVRRGQERVYDVIFVDFYARLGHRVQVSLVSVFVEDLVTLLCRADIAYLSVPEAYEVLDRADRARITVAEHFVEVASDAVHSRVHKIRYLVLKQGNVFEARPSKHDAAVEVRRLHEDGKAPVDYVHDEQLVFQMVADQGERVLYPRKQRREERRYECFVVGGQDTADRVAGVPGGSLKGLQLGGNFGQIPHFPGGLNDALACGVIRSSRGNPVQNSGNGGDRDAGGLSDIL